MIYDITTPSLVSKFLLSLFLFIYILPLFKKKKVIEGSIERALCR